MGETEMDQDKWREKAHKTFNFVCYARDHYAKGTNKERKAILMGLGSNQTVNNKSALILLPKYFNIIEEFTTTVLSKKLRFESEKNGFIKEKNEKTGSSEPALSYLLPIQIPLKLLKLSCRI